MPRKKKQENYARLGTKSMWDPFGLQTVPVTESGERGFAKVVNNILNGRHIVLPFVHRHRNW